MTATVSSTRAGDGSTVRPLLVPINQVSPYLGGLSRSTIYKLLRTGELPSCQLRSRRFVAMTDLEALVERLRAGHAI